MTTTLYHAPMACSLAVRFAAAEGQVPLNVSYLNLRTKEMNDGGSLFDVNPLGQVSVLQHKDGTLLTETSAALLWVQAQSTDVSFKQAADSPEYFQLVRWISFCATELHKQIFRVVFYPEANDAVKDRIRALAPARFQMLNEHLADRSFLLGPNFSAADAYLAWFFVLAGAAELDSSSYLALERYREQVLARPKLQALITQDRQHPST